MSIWNDKREYILTHGDEFWGFKAGSIVKAHVGIAAVMVHDNRNYPDATEHSKGHWCVSLEDWKEMGPVPYVPHVEPVPASFVRAGLWLAPCGARIERGQDGCWHVRKNGLTVSRWRAMYKAAQWCAKHGESI